MTDNASDARLRAMARQFLRANEDRDDTEVSDEARELGGAVARGCNRHDRDRFQLLLNDLCRRFFGRC